MTCTAVRPYERGLGADNLEKHNEIITIVDKSEYQKLMNFINREDPKAFVTIYNVSGMQYQPDEPRERQSFAWYTQVRKDQSAWRE